LDKDLLCKGFNSNLNNNPTDDCLQTIQKLFGPTYQDFNKRYVKEGSLCMGKMTGYAFYSDIKKLGGLNDGFCNPAYQFGISDTVNTAPKLPKPSIKIIETISFKELDFAIFFFVCD
jgi:hypothetical protein